MAIFDKLFFLAVRQVSKPAANALKTAAVNSTAFSAVLQSVGQGLHRLRIQVTRASEGKLRLAKISPLTPERAVAEGGDMLAEVVIYSVAGATIAYDYRKNKQKEAAKEAKEDAMERKRIEESVANERRQWDEFRHLQQRITNMQEEIWALRQQQAAQRSWFRLW